MSQTIKNDSHFLVRRSSERGHVAHGWLDSYHTFSFAGYYDHRYLGFRSLRVINEDRVAPGMGFDEHPHENMEILTYVIQGELRHQDSLGGVRIIRAGGVQKMTAGTGIVHSEYNASREAEVHFLQIWIRPNRTGLEPSYTELDLPQDNGGAHFWLIGSSRNEEGRVLINQDVRVYRLRLAWQQDCAMSLEPGRGIWVQMVRGLLDVNGITLSPGDGLSVENLDHVRLMARSGVEALVFDLG